MTQCYKAITTDADGKRVQHPRINRTFFTHVKYLQKKFHELGPAKKARVTLERLYSHAQRLGWQELPPAISVRPKPGTDKFATFARRTIKFILKIQNFSLPALMPPLIAEGSKNHLGFSFDEIDSGESDSYTW